MDPSLPRLQPVADGRAHSNALRTRPAKLYCHLLPWIYAGYLISYLLPAFNDSPSPRSTPLYGWGAAWLALMNCVNFDDGSLGACCLSGTICNVVMLAGLFAGRGGFWRWWEKTWSVIALGSALLVWTIPLWFGGPGGFAPFMIGYYLWAASHTALGTRIFFQSTPVGGPQAPALPRDDWFKDQSGGWDQARDLGGGSGSADKRVN